MSFSEIDEEPQQSHNASNGLPGLRLEQLIEWADRVSRQNPRDEDACDAVRALAELRRRRLYERAASAAVVGRVLLEVARQIAEMPAALPETVGERLIRALEQEWLEVRSKMPPPLEIPTRRPP